MTTQSDPRNTLNLTGQYDRFSVGRAREGDALSLVLPPETVTRVAEACADRKSTRLNSSHLRLSRMPSSA